MKVAELLEARRKNWHDLSQLCMQMEGSRKRSLGPTAITRFAALYRAACADLALADAYQLPPNTVQFLHQLVGRAHNQLYLSRKFDFQGWRHELLYALPQRLFHDNCLRLAFFLFWGVFLAAMAYGATSPEFAEEIAGKELLSAMESNYAGPVGGHSIDATTHAFGGYVFHNAGIGLRCFAAGLLFGIGGLFETIFNAAYLGTIFGHMTTVPQKINFFTFVTAHGPFELTGIILGAGAGMRLGFSLVDTKGYSRSDSLRLAAKEAVPAACLAVILFVLAAIIEGYISHAALPYSMKAGIAVASSGIMMFYFVLLGYPKENRVQLDKTRIAIRERSFPDIMDLALKVCRGHAPALLITTLLGTIPAVLFNHWMLSGMLDQFDSYSEPGDSIAAYLWFTLWWVVFEIPLVAVPTTLYLGQALFLEKPSVRRMLVDFWRSLPQLFVFQVLLRGILTLLIVPWFVLFVVWPYLNEILLLERNPLSAGRKGGISTMGRANAMHGRNIGELFGRWVAAAFLGTLLVLSLWISAWFMRGFLFQQWEFDPAMLTIWFQVALWSVLGYFTVVRYLSYLDLRIRTEGWEVELLMRAEGERLTRQLA